MHCLRKQASWLSSQYIALKDIIHRKEGQKRTNCILKCTEFTLWVIRSIPFFILTVFSNISINNINILLSLNRGFPGSSTGKESACNAEDLGSIPGLGRSPEEGHDNPLQYTCLKNPMDREAWQAINYIQIVKPKEICMLS